MPKEIQMHTYKSAYQLLFVLENGRGRYNQCNFEFLIKEITSVKILKNI
jgi:hypothetical protein